MNESGSAANLDAAGDGGGGLMWKEEEKKEEKKALEQIHTTATRGYEGDDRQRMKQKALKGKHLKEGSDFRVRGRCAGRHCLRC